MLLFMPRIDRQLFNTESKQHDTYIVTLINTVEAAMISHSHKQLISHEATGQYSRSCYDQPFS